MKDKLKSIKNSYLTYAILFVIILILVGVAVSYAYFKVNSSNSSTPSNIGVSLECMDITYSETDTISLDYNYPISDSYALEKIKPVTITVTNNCTAEDSNVTYTLALSSLYNSDGYIGDDQIRMKATRTMPNESENVIRTPMYLNMLDDLPKGDALVALKEDLKTRENASDYQNSSSYIIDSNTVSQGETITYKVYLWVDYYEGDLTKTGLRDNSTEGKNFAAAISIITNDDLHDIDLGEAYALYTESNSTLTFVRSVTPYTTDDTYNNVDITAVYSGFEEGTNYGYAINYDNMAVYPINPEWNNSATTIVFEDEIRPNNTAGWFMGFANLETISGLEKLNTAQVTNMSSMFAGVGRVSSGSASKELNLDLTKLDVSNVRNMAWMFSGVCNNNENCSINITGWDTKNVTDMSWLFFRSANKGIDVVGINDINVSNVTDMSWMFNSVDLSMNFVNWNTSHVTNMQGMFCDATINENIGIENWDVSNVTDMSDMFSDAVINTNINLSNWNVALVTSYDRFSNGTSGTGTLTQPNWIK